MPSCVLSREKDILKPSSAFWNTAGSGPLALTCLFCLQRVNIFFLWPSCNKLCCTSNPNSVTYIQITVFTYDDSGLLSNQSLWHWMSLIIRALQCINNHAHPVSQAESSKWIQQSGLIWLKKKKKSLEFGPDALRCIVRVIGRVSPVELQTP